MHIFDPIANFISELVASRQTYRCLVDGRCEFRGEALPVGTQAQVLSWIMARYKLIGELFVVCREYPQCVWFCCGPLSPRRETWLPDMGAIRYLVEVDGEERMFVLRPSPDGLLEWRPSRQLTVAD